jgi:small-conductance mechanosensitive channel
MDHLGNGLRRRRAWLWGRGGARWAASALALLIIVTGDRDALAATFAAVTPAAGAPATGMPATGMPATGKAPTPAEAARAAKDGSPAPAQPASPAPSPAGAQPVLPLTSDQVAGHLGETVDWFHHLSSIEQLQIAAADAASGNKLHQQALSAVGLAFDFGKACAGLLDVQSRQTAATAAPAASKGLAGRLDQAATNVEQQITAFQAQLDALKEQIAHARGKERETLSAQQGQVTAALQLAREVQSSVHDMEDFEVSSIAGDHGNLSPLDGQIADMERSVPELRGRSSGSSRASALSRGANASATAASTSAGGSSGSGTTGGASAGGGSAGAPGGATAGVSGAGGAAGSSATQQAANTFRADSAGVIALVTEWFAVNDMRRQLNDSIKETGDLQDEIEKVRSTLTNEVRTLVGNGLSISTSTDPTQLLAQRQALEADTARFRQLSTVLVPLGDQALMVESAASTLKDWLASLDARMKTLARYLVLRIGIVLGWIAVVLVVSEVWRRATFRYLHDLRRRRQFMVLRRVAVGMALTLVIVFGLVSEIGSIATYIGFVTAGVAVALQNVILSVVAYFFLIGRYGVRVGDRITLAGVTGRVVDIGLVRIYLMELLGPDLHATGRMIVLSNAVLFQPTALFKQIPGADYVWHTATLTIDATADVMEADKRLRAASDAVYEKYRAAIERQHAVVQRFIDFDASSPRPEVRVRLTENGLECSVRYPVELENAAVIDQQMLKALRDAFEHDSQFKLLSSGAVVLKSSD